MAKPSEAKNRTRLGRRKQISQGYTVHHPSTPRVVRALTPFFPILAKTPPPQQAH